MLNKPTKTSRKKAPAKKASARSPFVFIATITINDADLDLSVMRLTTVGADKALVQCKAGTVTSACTTITASYAKATTGNDITIQKSGTTTLIEATSTTADTSLAITKKTFTAGTVIITSGGYVYHDSITANNKICAIGQVVYFHTKDPDNSNKVVVGYVGLSDLL